jgi:hypothetical protein
MPSDCPNRCRALPQSPRGRQFLPVDRQKMPDKLLKYHKKDRLNFPAASFNDWKPYGVSAFGIAGRRLRDELRA